MTTIAYGSTSATNLPYIHNQDTPSAVWIINHDRGYYPPIVLRDSLGREFTAIIEHPTINQSIVYMTAATGGTASAR